MRRIGHIGLPVDELPDETLLAGFGSGSDELSVAFVRRFQAKVFAVSLAITGDRSTAEDVAQQAFERAWRHAGTYDPVRGSVATWLSAIARNTAIDTVRIRPAVPIDADELVGRIVGRSERAAGPEPAAGPEQAAMDGETARALRAAVRRLPPDQARAIVLAAIGGLSASQIAANEDIPLGTAKTRIRTAVRRLRSALVETGADDG